MTPIERRSTYVLSYFAMVEITIILCLCDILILLLLLYLYMFLAIFLHVYGPCVSNKYILLYCTYTYHTVVITGNGGGS